MIIFATLKEFIGKQNVKKRKLFAVLFIMSRRQHMKLNTELSYAVAIEALLQRICISLCVIEQEVVLCIPTCSML